jgi:cell division protein FtsL
MVRLLNLFAILALVGSAIYAYSIKYETIFHAEKIAELKHQIKNEEDAIGMAKAEWAHVSRPERVRLLADKLLDLQPLALNQIVGPEALPEKGMRVDEIGRKLEALGLSEPTNTPRDGTVVAPVTPSSPMR